ncbi:serine/threonine-protein kinase [Massilia yuzhufengensis]|uniref:Serine/threonine protein kinase n=1 Tax=Massilia yuzhufengensis TaxID=1164594 RepID=A0A1I1PVA8_9BURK|nr:serine/threonine-protein kinase [Massilia yuzhufengensis]SFD11518.1 serine/threonine protein kinase [Massilia yuzhufengensis]
MVQQDSIVSLARGQYRLREQLGGSAYGVVWRADAPGTGGSVAIKLVNTEQMARAPGALRGHWADCARQEMDFLAGLAPWDARHIVRLLDSGVHEGLPAMALELLDGDLTAHLASERAAGRATGALQVLDWTAQVNQALAKVHAAGFRYLDLKPGNLLIERRSGALKLADFGTSRALPEAATHSYAGTANWQAPEQFFPQARGQYLTDTRSDYFALGALLYFLACGRMLRYSAACGQAYGAHGRDGAATLRAPDGSVPPTLQPDEAAAFGACFGGAGLAASALLRRLLAAQPEARPRHALEISRMLGAVRAGLEQPLRRAA